LLAIPEKIRVAVEKKAVREGQLGVECPVPVAKSGKFGYTIGWLEGGEPGSTGLVKSKLRVVVGQQATLKADY